MSSYTNIFGGDQIDPSALSYVAYTTDASLTLVWPFEALDDTYVAANIIDINATAASLTVSMPNATLISAGQANLFNNVGANAFTVVDYSGNTIITVAPGAQWFVYLTSNATVNGTWRSIRYGAATSTADAAALAGYGLRASLTKLDQNILEVDLLGNYAFTVNDRAQLFCNEGGAVTWSFASAATLTNGWFVYVVNCGSGAITLDPNAAETIDNNPTKTINPGESCIVFCNGTNFNTVGYGRSLVTTVSAVAVNAAGTGTLSLNSTQTAAQIQDFSGTLTGNRVIDYGGGVGYWFVYNNTSGAYTMTFRVNNLDPGVTVSQGSFSILRSNGTTMSIAFTATSGTVTSVATAAGELTGGPITTTGTIGLANTAVTPASYGAANKTLTATVDGKGRITAMADTAIAITGSQVTDLNAIIAAAILAAEPIGTIRYKAVAGEDTGWLYAGGGTIGNASSNASSRANADTATLYAGLWNSDSNLAIYTSAGALTSRGASAAADFAANKALALPDYRGRALFGRDNMGPLGTAGRVTAAGSGITGTSLGASGGQQTEQTTVSGTVNSNGVNTITVNMVSMDGPNTVTNSQPGVGEQHAGPTHTHANIVSQGTQNIAVTGTISGGATAVVTNMPPAAVANVLIKYA